MNVKFLDLQKINQSYGTALEDAANGVIRSGWYLLGTQLGTFEQEWAEYCGARHAIGVGNGLDALRLVLTCWKIMYGWQDGDEVIVPANTFIATPLAVSQAGLTPVFCDVNDADALIRTDEDYLSTLLTDRTRCIIPVHLYGRLANLDAIHNFASAHNLLVLEDACQAHGAKSGYQGSRTCAYSFYPGKNLGALGDGGCVTTDDDELATLVRNVANYGQSVKYVHDFQGINSRLDEIQAAILRVKLQRLDADNSRRREIASRYEEAFAGKKTPNTPDLSNVYHIYAIRTSQRAELQAKLASAGIQTLIHYPIPCHHQKAYQTDEHLTLPNAERWCSETLSLPISPVLTDEEVEYVIRALS